MNFSLHSCPLVLSNADQKSYPSIEASVCASANRDRGSDWIFFRPTSDLSRQIFIPAYVCPPGSCVSGPPSSCSIENDVRQTLRYATIEPSAKRPRKARPLRLPRRRIDMVVFVINSPVALAVLSTNTQFVYRETRFSVTVETCALIRPCANVLPSAMLSTRV